MSSLIKIRGVSVKSEERDMMDLTTASHLTPQPAGAGAALQVCFMSELFY